MAFMKARDIEGLFHNKGPERASLYVCVVLAEQQLALQKEMRTLAEMLDQQTNIITQFATVAGNMKSAIDTLNGQLQRDDDLPPGTQLLGREDG